MESYGKAPKKRKNANCHKNQKGNSYENQNGTNYENQNGYSYVNQKPTGMRIKMAKTIKNQIALISESPQL